jgi:hypothetical protein
MSVIYEEQGAEIGDKEQEMTHVVHYVMKYLLKDGEDLSEEMLNLSIPILEGVVADETSGYVARLSALHMLALIHHYRGEEELLKAAQARAQYIELKAEQEEAAEVDVAYV